MKIIDICRGDVITVFERNIHDKNQSDVMIKYSYLMNYLSHEEGKAVLIYLLGRNNLTSIPQVTNDMLYLQIRVGSSITDIAMIRVMNKSLPITYNTFTAYMMKYIENNTDIINFRKIFYRDIYGNVVSDFNKTIRPTTFCIISNAATETVVKPSKSVQLELLLSSIIIRSKGIKIKGPHIRLAIKLVTYKRLYLYADKYYLLESEKCPVIDNIDFLMLTNLPDEDCLLKDLVEPFREQDFSEFEITDLEALGDRVKIFHVL